MSLYVVLNHIPNAVLMYKLRSCFYCFYAFHESCYELLNSHLKVAYYSTHLISEDLSDCLEAR